MLVSSEDLTQTDRQSQGYLGVILYNKVIIYYLPVQRYITYKNILPQE